MVTDEKQLKDAALDAAIKSTTSDFLGKESSAKDGTFLYGEMCSIKAKDGSKNRFVALWYEATVDKKPSKFKVAYSSVKAAGLETYPNKFTEFVPGIRNATNPKIWDKAPDWGTVS